MGCLSSKPQRHSSAIKTVVPSYDDYQDDSSDISSEFNSDEEWAFIEKNPPLLSLVYKLQNFVNGNINITDDIRVRVPAQYQMLRKTCNSLSQLNGLMGVWLAMYDKVNGINQQLNEYYIGLLAKYKLDEFPSDYLCNYLISPTNAEAEVNADGIEHIYIAFIKDFQHYRSELISNSFINGRIC